jgi:HPt (histidine-containing phosphotransfer) domain-containing protein
MVVKMIDWMRVDELRHEIGDDGFAEVVDLFLDEVEEVVERLPASAALGRLEGDLHFLKGSAWNLGFAGFGTLCQAGEKRAAAGGEVDIGPILAGYAQSKAEFMAGLADRQRPDAA